MKKLKEKHYKIVDNISPSRSSSWDEFVNNSEESSVYHLFSWQDLIQKSFGHNTYYLCLLDEEGEIAGVLPLIHLKSLLFGNFLVSVPYFNYGGCLAKNCTCRDMLINRAVELANELSASHIEFRDIGGESVIDMPTRNDKVSMRLKLPSDAEQLWSALGSKLRSQIKRPMRENPEVKIGGVELLDDFYKVFSQNMRDLGTPVYDRMFFKGILDTFKDRCTLVSVRKDNRPVAACFLIGYKGMMEIPWASSIKEFNKLGFNMLMYWAALKLSIENAYDTFDFGRSTKDSGTYRFKKQWGAEPVQLHWHYWLKDGGKVPMLNPSNPKYKLAINAWKKLPLPVANIIGPMLIKNLP
jgi:FemAB-related protein (PEP-CTERM system-associated)